MIWEDCAEISAVNSHKALYKIGWTCWLIIVMILFSDCYITLECWTILSNVGSYLWKNVTRSAKHITNIQTFDAFSEFHFQLKIFQQYMLNKISILTVGRKLELYKTSRCFFQWNMWCKGNLSLFSIFLMSCEICHHGNDRNFMELFAFRNEVWSPGMGCHG